VAVASRRESKDLRESGGKADFAIAWVTSRSSTGLVNLAPFSFFNAVGSDPLIIVPGMRNRQYWSPRRRVAQGYRKKHSDKQ
jgi:flavin reductase (DIM6/NTAB) family NADH-FMN oxidoreductase RutF